MNWKTVGEWLKKNSGPGAVLVGSLLTGNLPGAVAAGVSIVSGATGTDNPTQALEIFQRDPQTVVRLRELANQEQASIRQHIETMARQKLEDEQKEHEQQQLTIRQGDQSTDKEIRMTRPTMAKQSWVATIAYCIGCFGIRAITGNDVFDWMIASILSSPAWAYLGFRTGDKWADAWKQRGSK